MSVLAEVSLSSSARVATSLVDLVRLRAHQRGAEPLYAFESAGSWATMSYHDLDRRARQIAQLLRGSLSAGARCLLLHEPGLEYIAGFFGCLYAELVPVPAYPPGPDRLNRSEERIAAILRNSSAECILTSCELAQKLQTSLAPHTATIPQIVCSDEASDEAAGSFRYPRPRGADLAFLQYTSGSTGVPKGVALTHANLLSNLEAIERAFDLSSESKGVVWLPPYHDMGLIGGILAPLYTGFQMSLISPADFAARPLRWLEAISRLRATVSGGPNFAYELCARRARRADVAKLDLSQWTTAFVGAEPISARTLESFTQTFAPCGFTRSALTPCYGLAEATLLVSSAKRAEGPAVSHVDAEALSMRRIVRRTSGDPQAIAYVSSGPPASGVEVVVVDPQTREAMPPNTVGELWIRGPSVAPGYFNDLHAGDGPYQTQLASGGPASWLRSGDLGALLEDGEVVITGRLKDLIIIHGLNFYPSDLERSIERCDSKIRAGRVIAFPIVADGCEQLACAVETSLRSARPTELSECARTVRARIAADYGIAVHTLVFCAPGVLPRTSSGKLQRNECRQRFLDGTLETVWLSARDQAREPRGRAPETPMEKLIAGAFGSVLDCGELGVEDDFFEIGGTSLAAAQVAARLANEESVERVLQAIVVGRTVAALAAFLEGARAVAIPQASSAGELQPPSAAAVWTRLQPILSEVLRVSAPDPGANFFAIGGTSLAAMLLLARIREDFEVSLPLEVMLEAPTLEVLAGKVADALRAPATDDRADEPVQSDVPELVATSRPDRIPLSFAQQRLWLLDQFRSAALAYIIPVGLRLRGRLSESCLEQAFATIVQRHEALRTTFELRGSQPVQLVQPSTTGWKLNLLDCQSVPAEEREQTCFNLASEDSRVPFDLRTGPLLRAKLVRFSDTDHFLILSMHHIVSDGWSIGVLLKEFVTLYGTFLAGGRCDLPELPIQYPDYAIWQRSLLSERALASSVAFFRRQLDGVPSLRLPTSYPRSEQSSGHGKVLRFELEPALQSAVQDLAGRERATLFMLLLAAFRALLSSWSGQRDFAIGVPIANRVRPQLEPLIGFFVNTLAVRGDLTEDPSFLEIIRREKQSTLLCFGHQELPFDKLVEVIGESRDVRREPLISVMFALQNAPLGSLELPELAITPLWGIGETAKFELTLSLMEWQGAMTGQLEYSTDLFDATTALEIAAAYQRILAACCADPEIRLSQLEEVVAEAGPNHESFLMDCLARLPEPAPEQHPALDDAPPVTPTEVEVRALLAEVLEGQSLFRYSDFFRHGGTSLTAVLLLARIAERFAVEVSMEAFFAAPHVAGLAQCVDAQLRLREQSAANSRTAPRPDSEVDGCVRLNRGGRGPGLFLVHALHGDLLCYRELASALGTDIEVFGLSPRAAPPSTIEQLAQQHIDTLRKVQPHGPYALGGFSFGGIVAQEMARQLEARGERVDHLLLLDAHANAAGSPLPAKERQALARELEQYTAFADTRERARHEMHVEACVAALERHAPGRFSGPATLVRASASPGRRDRGWRKLIGGGLRTHEVKATHATLLRRPFADEVAELTKRCLAARVLP